MIGNSDKQFWDMNLAIQKDTMKEKQMCKHENIVYVGQQERHNCDAVLYLYNCRDCDSTISYPEISDNAVYMTVTPCNKGTSVVESALEDKHCLVEL